MSNGSKDLPGVIAPPPLIDLAWFAAGLLLDRSLPVPRLHARPLGVPLVLGGALLAGWAIATMRSARTTISPYEPSTELVTEGPFRFSRNPIYLGGTLIYAGLALLLDRVGPVLLLPGLLATIGSGVIEREERFLERRFGDRYRDYQRVVPRWLPG